MTHSSVLSAWMVVLTMAVVGCSGGAAETTASTGGEEATPEGEEAAPEGEEAAPEGEEAAAGGSDEARGPVAGGWGDADLADVRVRQAADFAVAEQARRSGATIALVRIEWAAQQVVSGMNYRLGLHVTRNGAAEQATAQVYSQPWSNTTQLTSWTVGFTR